MDFQNKYDRKDFLRFLRNNLLGDKFEEVEHTSILPNFKSSFFTKITKLGVVEEFDNLIVLEIEHKSKSDARIALTKDIFKLLRQFELEGLLRQHALVILINPDTEQYRFSLLTTTYNEDFEEKLSNPKRFSYLLGFGEKTKTAKDYLEKKGIVESFDDLVDRFNVEVVRKQFFNDYLVLYITLYKAVLEDIPFLSLLKLQQVEIVSFTKNLLGKIVFLYFIQKKGWLGVSRDGEFGKDGDKNFMRSIWQDFKNNEESLTKEKTGYFYNDYLEWLFYDGLNKDRRDSEDYFPNLKMKVPYLNGGLFKEDYKKWDEVIAKISNGIFSNTDNTGILDIFDTYNFTIDEDDLYDSDIAIDPEMLGRIFEKMISISPENIDEILKIYESKKKIEIDKELNKKFGAFYTPREIVHYMTRESIISYLINNLTIPRPNGHPLIKGDKTPPASLPPQMRGTEGENKTEKQIRLLFNLKEKFLLNKDDLKQQELPENTFDELGEIIEKVDVLLKKVKILDPAIGSGAFPMGILHEISSIRYYIYGVFYQTFGMNTNEYKNEKGRLSMYKIKKNIIQNSIYGVDISSGAIDIARLRFWLSLVVDEEIPEPLPNFEFKFIVANTLIPLEKEHALGEDHGFYDKLKEIRDKFFSEDKRLNKNKQKEEYYKIIGKDENGVQKLGLLDSKRLLQLKDYDPFVGNKSCSFFDSNLMLGVEEFDIIIGNPPYGVSIKGDYRKVLEKSYDKVPDYEIYYYFIEIAYRFLKNNGINSYIIPNTFIFNVFAEKYREKLLLNWGINELLDCTNFDIFENATVRNVITLFSKNNLSKNVGYRNTKNVSNFNDLIRKNKEYILLDELNKKNWGLSFKLDKKVSEVLLKISNNSGKVSDFFDSSQGYIPYRRSDLIEVYGEIEGNKIVDNKLWHSNVSEDENYKKEILGKDLYPFGYYKATGEYIKYGKHLACYVDEKFFNQERVLVREITNPKIYSSYVKDFFVNNPSIITTIKKEGKTLDLKYLLGFLNSKLATFYHFNSSPKATKGAFPKILVTDLKNFPIKQISLEEQKPFIEKVDQILEITKKPGYKPKEVPEEQKRLEKEIDEMVYKLYNLDIKEIEVIEESLV